MQQGPVPRCMTLYVIDIGHDLDLSFNNKELSELQNILTSIYSGRADQNESLIDTSILALTGILTDDVSLYNTALESEGGERIVCKFFEERDKKIREEAAAIIAEKDALLAEKDKERESLLAEKNAEIEELKRKLAEASICLA